MTLRQKAIKGIAWSSIQGWGCQAISFLVFLLLARILGPKTFGLIALANIFINFIQLFLDQGFAEAIVQRQELEREHLDTAFWSNIGSGLLLMLICLVASSSMANFFREPQLTLLIRWLSLTLLIGSLNGVQQALFRRKLAFKTLAIRNLLSTSIGAIVSVVMAFYGWGVWSLVGLTLVDRSVSVLILWGVSEWRPGFRFSLKHFNELVNFGVNVLGISILVFLSRRVDDFLIGYFLGSVTLGYYSIAYRVLTIMTQLLYDKAQGVAMPIFSQLQEEPERFRRVFYKTSQVVGLIALPFFLGVAALSPELVRGLFGNQWAPSIPVLQLLAIAGAIQSLFCFSAPALMAKGKPSWNLGLFCLGAVTNVIAFFLVVRLGIVAVAASLVITNLLLTPINLQVLRRIIRIDLTVYLSKYVVPLMSSLVMIAAILGAKYFLDKAFNSQILLVFYASLGIIVYAVTVFLIAPKLYHRFFELARSSLAVNS